jgi:hypothetical protein
MVRHHALEQTAELCPPPWFGLQLDDHLDYQITLSSPPGTAPPVMRSQFLLAAAIEEASGA